MCWAGFTRVVRFYVKSLSVHPDAVLFLGLPNKGSPVFKLDKALGMFERLMGLGEMGREGMTEVSDTLSKHM